RVDGFRSAAAEAGADLPDDRVAHGDWTRAGGAALAARLLAGPDRPSAVFACSDTMALGVYDAAAAAGLRVPDDLAVVGFDDLPEGEWVHPGLTTVRQPIAQMGAAALRMLLRLGDDAGPGTRADPRAELRAEAPREELATTLVVRGSTAPPGPTA
ncbi:LacI family DNA-binding transcriptional regulator, partial [Isoptericola sp. QY 916]|nr:substrate-binding domain-containing protein [Isoptericola sp. QY 916]